MAGGISGMLLVDYLMEHHPETWAQIYKALGGKTEDGIESQNEGENANGNANGNANENKPGEGAGSSN